MRNLVVFCQQENDFIIFLLHLSCSEK